MSNDKMIELAELFAAELHRQADSRRERAISAAKLEMNGDEEVDRWRVAFSTSYQTLRGMANACASVASALRARATEQGK